MHSVILRVKLLKTLGAQLMKRHGTRRHHDGPIACGTDYRYCRLPQNARSGKISRRLAKRKR